MVEKKISGLKDCVENYKDGDLLIILGDLETTTARWKKEIESSARFWEHRKASRYETLDELRKKYEK